MLCNMAITPSRGVTKYILTDLKIGFIIKARTHLHRGLLSTLIPSLDNAVSDKSDVRQNMLSWDTNKALTAINLHHVTMNIKCVATETKFLKHPTM